MTRNPVASTRDDADINLTPMLDVVFIMLIFFIVTASFIREFGLDVNRPDSTPPDTLTVPSILISVDPNDQLWIDGRHIDLRALRANLERLRAERPDGAVVVDVASESHADRLVAVLDAARAAGIHDLAMTGARDGSP